MTARVPLARRGAFWLAACALLVLTGCGEDGGNFSQYTGFKAYFDAHPPSRAQPPSADQVLLRRYRPRIFVPAGHEGPIHFYEDYVAQGRLIGADGKRLSDAVTPALLNRMKDDPGVEFRHVPAANPPRAAIFARIDRETVRDDGGRSRRLTFLTYHAVFRRSGLPAGLAGWKAAALGLVVSLGDWHQLDHYTAVMVTLTDAIKPVAVTFQQHNYLRTYILGRDLILPPDGRVAVDVAIRSNELYPRKPGRHRRRAVGFLTPETARYLITGKDKPFRAADDITDSAREVDYALEFLPPADALYTFKGYLGERRLLPGRSGPPGADYNTLPRFKPRAMQLAAFHWREDDTASLDRLTAIRTNDSGRVIARLLRKLDCPVPVRIACAKR